MITLKRTALLGATAIMVMSASAHASMYFVRPTAQFGAGELIDGYEGNGQTYKEVSYNDAARSIVSSVDLSTGELKIYAAEDSAPQGAWGNAIMGETITIRNGAGTTWNFEFGADGTFEATGGPVAPGANEGMMMYDLALAIYRPGQVDYTNWFARAQATGDGVDPLFFDYISNYIPVGGADYSNSILESIMSSLVLESNYEQFEIYAKIYAGGYTSVGGGITSYVADFSHTATIALNFEDGVETYSASGEFLGLISDPNVTSVPEPGSLALLLAGMMGLVGFTRRDSFFSV